MSTESHEAAASSSSSSLIKSSSHEEQSTAGKLLPELTTAIEPTVRASTNQLQLSAPIEPHPKQQLAVVPRAFHQHTQQYSYPVYPQPLATHGELVQNKELFLSTLTNFHVTMGTKLTIPKIGGKELDLHLLYREVTARGGLQMVINERKWKEITVVLNFPRTTTSASFVLRRYYINLLHHYEQVHFFRVQGPLVPPPVPPPNLSPAMNQTIEANYKRPVLKDPEIERKKQKIDSAQALGVDPASSIGTIVSGSIDGKIEQAYLVTVNVGARKMKGVLYHVPPGSIPQGASVSAFVNTLEPGFSTTMEHRAGSKQKRKEMSRKDPRAPRQNRTGYNFFFAEQRAKLKSVEPDKDRRVSKLIGDKWNRLSEDEKSPYQERGLEDKERYKREMRVYKEQLRCERNFQNSLLACKYNSPSSDVTGQIQPRLEYSKPLQEQAQHGSRICSGTAAILEKHSCSSVTDHVENQPYEKHQSTEDEHPVTRQRDACLQGKTEKHQSPEDEHPVIKQEPASPQGQSLNLRMGSLCEES